MTTLLRMPAVEAPDLFLREILARDVAGFARYMTRPEYQRWIAQRFTCEEDVRTFVRGALLRQNGPRRRSFQLAAVGRAAGGIVGDGFILLAHDETAEVGWGVAPALWGRGFGSQIARVLVALAVERLGARRAWCKVMSPNVASLKVAARAGMTRMRTQSAFSTGTGQTVDVHMLAIEREAYFESSY